MTDADDIPGRLKDAADRLRAERGTEWAWPHRLDRIDALADLMIGVAEAHFPSAYPVSRGHLKGLRYCWKCTDSVDDQMIYAPWPCPDLIRWVPFLNTLEAR